MNGKRSRSTETQISNEFTMNLNLAYFRSTSLRTQQFNIVHQDYEKLIKIPDDLDQRDEGRKGYIARVETKLAKNKRG